MEGICCSGPRPVSATCFIASKSSRRASGARVALQLVEPAAILQLQGRVVAEEVRRADGIVGPATAWLSSYRYLKGNAFSSAQRFMFTKLSSG